MTVEERMAVDDLQPSHGTLHWNSETASTGNGFQLKTMNVNDPVPPTVPQVKKFTVYLNGVSGIGQEVNIEFDQLCDWNDFVLELDSGITFSAPTNEVFTITGVRLGSISEVLQYESLVVGSGQPFIPLQYKNLPTPSSSAHSAGDANFFTKNIQMRKSTGGSARKFIRNGLAKSVYAIDETFQGSSSSSNNELNSLLKTMSEEQVCFRDLPAMGRIHGQLPNSVIRQTIHSKPRPVSCYGSPHSIYSGESPSSVKKTPSSSGSKIPKRIIAQNSPVPELRSNSVATSANPIQSSSSLAKSIPIISTPKSAPKLEKVTSRTVIPKEKNARQGKPFKCEVGHPSTHCQSVLYEICIEIH